MKLLTFLGCLIAAHTMAQTPELPYRVLPAPPKSYTPAAMAARMIDGLAFRYYWATDALRTEDLDFKPKNDSRTSRETINHIYDLTVIIANTVAGANTFGGKPAKELSFPELRKLTLENLKSASDRLTANPETDLSQLNVMLGGSKTDLPFWNLVNGPIEDAAWHVGQVVTFRRSSGNPFNSKVSVLRGTVKE